MGLVWTASSKLAGRMTCFGKKGAEDFLYYEMLKNKILFYFKKSINEVKNQVYYRVGQNKKSKFRNAAISSDFNFSPSNFKNVGSVFD